MVSREIDSVHEQDTLIHKASTGVDTNECVIEAIVEIAITALNDQVAVHRQRNEARAVVVAQN